MPCHWIKKHLETLVASMKPAKYLRTKRKREDNTVLSCLKSNLSCRVSSWRIVQYWCTSAGTAEPWHLASLTQWNNERRFVPGQCLRRLWCFARCHPERQTGQGKWILAQCGKQAHHAPACVISQTGVHVRVYQLCLMMPPCDTAYETSIVGEKASCFVRDVVQRSETFWKWFCRVV